MFDLIPARFSQHRLTITAAIGLALLFLLTGATLLRLIVASVEKERSHNTALFDRDLRELAGRLDADERNVLEHNLSALLSEDRVIQPLLLPRQYFVGLPAGNSSFTPRPPPRNCYVDLVVSATNAGRNQNTDRFCAYFTSNRGLGSYLFLAMTFVGSSVVPLRQGDVALNADAIRLSVRNGEHSALWWLALQPPRGDPLSSKRFEVTAIREGISGRRERDYRIEGWAYQQQQPDGTVFTHLIARLDYHAIVPQEPLRQNVDSQQRVAAATVHRNGRQRHRGRAIVADSISEPWPPKNWQDVTIQLARKSVDPNTRTESFVSYDPRGITNLSASALSSPFVNAYATLRIREQLGSGEQRRWTPIPPTSLSGKFDGADSWLRFVNGDIQIQLGEPLVREQIVPDTNLVFEVTHPGIVVEKGVWQTAALLTLVLFGFLGLARHFWIRLLKPISILSANAATLARSPVGSEQELPYGNNKDEVGTLSKAFNDLLGETRIRATREQVEREKRNEEARQKHLEEVKAREISLKTIGHEIRSPLQALIGLHQDDDPSRRYIDRMIRAVDHLFGKAGPASFDSVPIDLQRVDIADFLFNQAINAATAQSPIKNVKYNGPRNGIVCQVDPDAFEDTVAHILENAERFRIHDTPIRVHLADDAGTATISISNNGPQIPENLLEDIFEFGFSPTENRDESNQGIGLYAARNYVSRMKGHIRARNTASGVEFTISFPLDK